MRDRGDNFERRSFGRLFLVQVGADVQRVVGVNSALVKFDMLDDSVLVDDDIRPLRPLVCVALNVVPFEDAVGDEHFLVHVAQEGKLHINLLGESCVCCGGIHTDAENCGFIWIDLTGSESSLDRLKLFRSTTSKGENVHGEKDILLAAEVRELDGLPFVAEQTEVRSLIADLECGLGDLVRVLRAYWNGDRNWQRRGQQE